MRYLRRALWLLAVPGSAVASTCTPPCFAAIAIETSLLITFPSITLNTSCPVGDSRRYGAVGNGVANDTVPIQFLFDVCTMAGVQGSIYPGTYLISTPITIALTSNPAISSPATDFGFSIAGSGVTSCIFVIASTFSGGSYAFQLKGTGAFAGWRIGGFLIQPSASGSGSATVGWQIGDPSVAAIKIYGYQYSTIYDVAIEFFPTAWQVTNARMIRFVDCSGWNEGFSSQNTCLSITQYQSLTGDLLFGTCAWGAALFLLLAVLLRGLRPTPRHRGQYVRGTCLVTARWTWVMP